MSPQHCYVTKLSAEAQTDGKAFTKTDAATRETGSCILNNTPTKATSDDVGKTTAALTSKN